MPPRWLAWPKLLRDLAWKTLLNNALARRFSAWVALCHDAPDFAFVGHVLLHGAPICTADNRPPPTSRSHARNHPSALSPEFYDAVHSNRVQECGSGLLLRVPPWQRHVFESVGFGRWLHPLGAVYKYNGTLISGVRVIDDYSFPSGGSVNDRINYLRLRYDKVDNALAFVYRHPGCYAAKIDIKGFFRHIAVDPFDWPLMVALWDFGDGWELLIDTHLPFGLRHSPEIACRVSLTVLFAVRKELRSLGIDPDRDVFISVVVDDWLVLAATHDACLTAWRVVLRVLKALGFSVNELPHKLLSPRQEIAWLGLLLNTVTCTVRLPDDKVRKGVDLLNKFLARYERGAVRTCTRKELDSLIGYLSYCSGVVYGGRAFLHRMRRLRFRAGSGHAMPVHHRIHMDLEFKLDAEWWLSSLFVFNGQANIVDPTDDCDIRLDATGDGGLGLFCDGAFLALSPDRVRITPECVGHPQTTWANEWELFNFVVLLRFFGPYLANKIISPLTDSACAVFAITKWSTGSLDARYCASTLRSLFSLCVRYNIRLRPRWIPGDSNHLADALSRQHWPRVAVELASHTRLAHGVSSPFCLSLCHAL